MARKNLNAGDPHIRTLRQAEKLAQEQVDDDCFDELNRVGILWAGILNLERQVIPTEVVAMLAAYELIRASRLTDAEPHWTKVAEYAAIGSFLENMIILDTENTENDETSEVSNVGFTAKI